MEKCKRKRTIFNLFEVYSCNGCNKHLIDKEYSIGDTKVNIYYLGRKCLDNKYNNKYITNNINLKKYLIECIKYSKDITIIWMDISQNFLLENDNFIYNLLEFDKDIHILIF